MTSHLGFPLEIVLIFVGVIGFSVLIDVRAYRKGALMSVKEATAWSVFWVFAALAFYGFLWWRFDRQWADLFLVGYVLEESLSVDNLMVFMAVFTSFNIKGLLQRRILFFGILGAIAFRLIFASIGTAMFAMSPWVGFLFAAIVAWTGWKMLTAGEGDEDLTDYSEHWSVGMTEKVIPIFPRLHLERFFINSHIVDELKEADPSIDISRPAALYATPAFLCLIAVQVTDVMFSFDSVPAVVAVTGEPILVYGAMIFAVLGLRALYYLLAGLMRYLVHLEKAVIALLFYIALKLSIQASNELFHWPGVHIPPAASLGIVLTILGIGVAASLIFPENSELEEDSSSA